VTDPDSVPCETVYGGTIATLGTAEPESLLLPGHDVPLGRYTTVRRLLPQRVRRMVGAWCFVDHFGPADVANRPGMQIGPHPHTGLQTVTWLVDGEIVHRDSLGSLQPIRPGQLNLMTSGHGIAHSEESPPDHPPLMHGLQLWVALPDAARHGTPRFEHHPTLPVFDDGVTVVVGALGRVRSPATMHSPIVGAEIRLPAGGRRDVPLDPSFEHAVLVMDGSASVADTQLLPGSLLYLGRGRSTLALGADSDDGARMFLIGGEPFDEPLVMWWNFVGRSHDDIALAREEWMGGDRFGVVRGAADAPLPAPPMPNVRLKARDRHGN
jgi:redox-sensitive bicupin YhaK (pirin superfamily)